MAQFEYKTARGWTGFCTEDDVEHFCDHCPECVGEDHLIELPDGEGVCEKCLHAFAKESPEYFCKDCGKYHLKGAMNVGFDGDGQNLFSCWGECEVEQL